MKLSEAMMLGSSTCKMVPADWNSCALGAAANAVGIPFAKDHTEESARIDAMIKYWPWLYDDKGYTQEFHTIWATFDDRVCKGLMTYEQLVDYVKSIEPECGECNQFKCTCTNTKDQEPVAATVQV